MLLNQPNPLLSQYQILYNQSLSLKKDYDNTNDEELKSALSTVLSKKIVQLETINITYTSTINNQIQVLKPQ